jgi:hypothetical protein
MGENQTSCDHSHCLYVCFSPLETTKHTDERRTDNENDDMTFVSSPLETIKHTDKRRLYVVRLFVLLSLMEEKQTSCHHSHCLYVVRLYVLLSLMGRNKRHVIILIVCTPFSPPLETVKHRDERRTDNENDDMTFVSPPLETCHHSHCLYVVRPYVLLSLMGRNKRHVIILIVCENDNMTFVSPH